jgi:ubiquinone/menaquinone biosynthesis C-methylase UbiE
LGKAINISANAKVLEIGCGEAGNLKPFLDRGCKCVGIDLNGGKIQKGKEFFASHPHLSNLELIEDDIYKITDFSIKFDIIMLRDVIEHIHNQDVFIRYMQNFMHSTSVVFFAFPPWQNPFGGHQQLCRSKVLSNLPYFHLLPVSYYKFVLKSFGESEATIRELLEIKETGISIERFERHVLQAKLSVLKVEQYFINPNYEIKFGLKPRKIFKIIEKTPYFRNFFITCCYYIIGLK